MLEGQLEARAEIARMRTEGLGWTAIARSLNMRGIPTPTGNGQWWASTAYRHTEGRNGWAAYIASTRRRAA